MPEEFYESLARVAGQVSAPPDEVLAHVLRVLESAYLVRDGCRPSSCEEAGGRADPLVPIWFKVPDEFWAQLGSLASKTGKGEEQLLTEGLDLLIRRAGFTLIQSH